MFLFFSTTTTLHRLFFFFSSRRRHTRWPRDWSSDVCSSDLVELDAEKLSDGTAKVTLVAVSQKGIDLLIVYDGEVDKTGSGESGAAGGQAEPDRRARARGGHAGA